MCNKAINKRRFVVERTFSTLKRTYGLARSRYIGLEKVASEVNLKAIAYNCINRNNHQKPTFHPLGDFLNPALALLGQGLKKSPSGQKLDFANHPYLCKGLLKG